MKKIKYVVMLFIMMITMPMIVNAADTEAPSKPTMAITLANSAEQATNKTVYIAGGSTDNVGISKYVIKYGTSITAMNVANTITTNETTYSYSIDSLNDAGTTYYFQVCAYDTSSNSACSDIVAKSLDIYRGYSTTSLTNVSTSTIYGTKVSEVISITGYAAMDNFTSHKQWTLAFNVYSDYEPDTTDWVDPYNTPKRCSFVMRPVRTTFVAANHVTTRASTWSLITQENTYTDTAINRTGSCIWSTNREVKFNSFSAGSAVISQYETIISSDKNTSVSGRSYTNTLYKLALVNSYAPGATDTTSATTNTENSGSNSESASGTTSETTNGENSSKSKTTDNPKTGQTVSIVVVGILTIAATTIYLYTKKKNALYKI